MKKEKSIFVCSECGYQSVKLLGRCPNCGKWNTFIEEFFSPSLSLSGEKETINPQRLNEIKFEEIPRIKTEIGEFDRVVGGGIVGKSYILVAGEP
ncbi:MAG: DNA repair protein RadA, partial [Candidatus Omnitrophica bacterium]|nr:DNA repair protein RadA [Candidatus Omnitrophota bacterium]